MNGDGIIWSWICPKCPQIAGQTVCIQLYNLDTLIKLVQSHFIEGHEAQHSPTRDEILNDVSRIEAYNKRPLQKITA